jgi:tetratricopeptide (TPR) repeat protein
MGNLQERLTSAIKLRESENHAEARQLLLELHAEFPEDPQVNYQCAWIHDLLGLEREAIPFYEKAIQAGLGAEDLKSALLGMGSTCRAIGDYERSITTFQQGLSLFPDSPEFNVFLAMALYNVGDYDRAMELLLNALADTSNDEGILRYRRAIRFYSDKLHQTW